MELGVAGTIATEHIISDSYIDNAINDWFDDNPDVEVIDIKFSSSSSDGNRATDALIIYRKDS